MRVSGIGALVLAAVARALDTCDCIPGFHEAKGNLLCSIFVGFVAEQVPGGANVTWQR